MKKHNQYYIKVAAGLLLIIISSCNKKFEQYTPNPNLPTSVPAYLLLRQIENDMAVLPGGDADKFCQYTLSSYTYYGTNECRCFL